MKFTFASTYKQTQFLRIFLKPKINPMTRIYAITIYLFLSLYKTQTWHPLLRTRARLCKSERVRVRLRKDNYPKSSHRSFRELFSSVEVGCPSPSQLWLATFY